MERPPSESKFHLQAGKISLIVILVEYSQTVKRKVTENNLEVSRVPGHSSPSPLVGEGWGEGGWSGHS